MGLNCKLKHHPPRWVSVSRASFWSGFQPIKIDKNAWVPFNWMGDRQSMSLAAVMISICPGASDDSLVKNCTKIIAFSVQFILKINLNFNLNTSYFRLSYIFHWQFFISLRFFNYLSFLGFSAKTKSENEMKRNGETNNKRRQTKISKLTWN